VDAWCKLDSRLMGVRGGGGGDFDVLLFFTGRRSGIGILYMQADSERGSTEDKSELLMGSMGYIDIELEEAKKR
jgi:hypothetical protein